MEKTGDIMASGQVER